MKYVIAFGLFAISVATAIFSANLSYVGLEATFESVPFIGFVGCIIALSTVTVSAAVGQARRQGQSHLMKGMAGLMVLAMVLDGAANVTATKGDVDAKNTAYQQALAAFDTANQTLATVRKDITKAERELETILGADVEAAQLVLVSWGQNIAVDGKRGPQTNKALSQAGRDLRGNLEAYRATETDAAAIFSAGLPEARDSSEMAFAIILALMLTLLSSSTSFAASLLMGGQEIDLDALEGAIDEGLSNVYQIEDWLDGQAA